MTSNVSESKCYTGERVLSRAVVTVHVLTGAGVTSYLLPHLVRHSPDGFNWGYLGGGPADLARSLLMDCLGADPAPQLYQAFKERFIAGLPQDAGWQIDEAAIRQWLDSRTDAQHS
jgi:hypothetical protein